MEEDPADDHSQEEECDVLTHQNTDSSMREKAELPASGSSTSPAGSPNHSPRPRGFGRGTPTGTTEQSTESRSGGSGGNGRGKPSSTQQSQVNSRYQSQSSPMLTRNRSQKLCLPYLQTRQTTQCLAAEQLWIRWNPRFFACPGVCQQRRQRHPRNITVRPKP